MGRVCKECELVLPIDSQQMFECVPDAECKYRADNDAYGLTECYS